MGESVWEAAVQPAARVLMQPITYHDLQVTFVDILGARHPRDWTTTEHRHPWFEFNYVSQGRLFTAMENIEFLVEPGQVFLIPPGVMHSHRHCEFSGDDGFCVRWKLKKLEWPEQSGVRQVADELIAGFSRFQPKSIVFPAEQVLKQIDGRRDFELEASWLLWLLQVYRAIQPEKNLRVTGPIREDARTSPVVHQVLMYLEAYYNTDVNVNQLADSLAYSYRHLSRLFKEQTGTTIIDKLNGIRIAKAIDLLVNTELPVSLIGSEVGFNTEAYFSTSFTAYTELSPSTYRNRFGKRK